jgi:hypothetical protein
VLLRISQERKIMCEMQEGKYILGPNFFTDFLLEQLLCSGRLSLKFSPHIYSVCVFELIRFVTRLTIAEMQIISGKWRRLHKKELYDLYSSCIIRVIKSRRLRWAGHVARMGERRGAYRVLVGKPEGRRPLGRPRHRWEDNIKLDL